MTRSDSMISIIYHTLYENKAELAALPADERPYAVSTDTFRTHLDLIESNHIDVVNPLKTGFKPGVVLTFDDGHKSFYQHALPLLQERNHSAIFFITPDLIESRDDFCDWKDLQDLVAAGMSVAAHGLSHRFLSEISAHEAADELAQSKAIIEQQCQISVQSLSFPGGRYNNDVVELARTKHYRYCFSSNIGALYKGDFLDTDLSQTRHTDTIPRIAIKQSTDLVTFTKIINANSLWLLKAKALSLSKLALKKTIGHHQYHRLYRLLSQLKSIR